MTSVLCTSVTRICAARDVVRYFSGSQSLYKGNGNSKLTMHISAKRSARMINKIMAGTKHIARKPDQSSPSKHLKDFGFVKGATGIAGSRRPVSARLLRRIDMLDNLFIEQITSLLATGEVSPEFLGLGIQISRVKITSDFSAVNVYWYASGTETDDKIEQLLTNSSGHLRHVLSQLRVIGVVPPINFHKDRTFSKLQEVETLLSKCGVPLQSSEQEDGESEEEDDYTECSQSTEVEASPIDSVGKNVMTHDILGVKHDHIMNEIKKTLKKQADRKKAREENIQASTLTEETHEYQIDPNSSIGDLENAICSHRKRQAEFLKYLKKQQAEKFKLLQRDSVAAKEKEFYYEMKEQRKTSQLQNRLVEMDPSIDNDDDTDDDEAYHRAEETYYKDFRESFK